MAAPITYTTQIDTAKTIGEIQAILSKAGAVRIAVDYDLEGQPSGLGFALTGAMGTRLFTLPVNIDAMHEKLVLEDQRGNLGSLAKAKRRDRGQAARVAWRVMKMWIESQLAMIDTGMVALDEVMLPYLRIGEQTVYEKYQETALLELTAGQS